MNASNSNNTLAARIPAEGLPKITTIAKAIGVVGESLKSHGLERVANGATLTNAQLASDLVYMVSYTGGYSMPGDYCYIVSRDTQNRTSITAPTVHSVRDYDNREMTPARKNAWIQECITILESHAQTLNLELVFGEKCSNGYHRYDRYTQVTPGCWKLIGRYDSVIESMEDNGVFLPEGIRALVAKHLGVDANDAGEYSVTYHRAFDEAVAQLHGN